MNNPQRRTVRALLVAMFVSAIPATLILPMLPSLGTAFDVGPTQLWRWQSQGELFWRNNRNRKLLSGWV